MCYKIVSDDFVDFLSPTDESKLSVTDNVNFTKLASPIGNILYKEHKVNTDTLIIDGGYEIQNNLEIFGKGNSNLLEIQFNLSNKPISYIDKLGENHVTPHLSGNIAFLSAEDNEATIFFQKNTNYQTFDIHLPFSLLENYKSESKSMDDFLNNIYKEISSNLMKQNIRLSSGILNSIQDIKNCNYDGLTRRIYLESKIFEIIALLHEGSEKQINYCKLKPIDQDKIYEAAYIIQNNLDNPFTITELARKVGVNQTKLKLGFKLLLNNTVFGYLQDKRMHKAKNFLLETNLSVQEIASLLGYHNTSNFSTAFKKIHGYSPLKLRERNNF